MSAPAAKPTRLPLDALATSGMLALCVCWGFQQIAIKLPSPSPAEASWVPLPAPIIPRPQPTEAFWTPIASANPPMLHACGHCKGDIRAGAKFCPSCGAIFAHA